MKVHNEVDNEAAQVKCMIAGSQAGRLSASLESSTLAQVVPSPLRSAASNTMSNTDWKGRVSKLYDQIAGNVHV